MPLLEKKYLDRISLIIVEAPFTSVSEVLESWVNIGFLAPMQLYLLDKFSKYNLDQVSPIDAVKEIPHGIPVAFITSKMDKTVPEHLTMELIEIMRDYGHEKVHHCSLDHSGHETMTIGNPDDRNKYISFVENLYEQYIDE